MNKPFLLGILGEAQSIIENYNAVLSFDQENREQFLHQLDRMVTDKELYLRCQAGCANLVKDFDRAQLALDMLQVIEGTVGAN